MLLKSFLILLQLFTITLTEDTEIKPCQTVKGSGPCIFPYISPENQNLNSCYWKARRKSFWCPFKVHQNLTIEEEEKCEDDCPKSCDDKLWLCDNKCIPMDTSCNGSCLNDNYFLCDNKCCPKSCDDKSWLCDNKCKPLNTSCHGSCPNDKYFMCDSKCYTAEELQKKNLWVCGDKCQTIRKPCNGSCIDGMQLNCNKACEKILSHYECEGSCISIEIPCNGKCKLENQVNCDGECIKNTDGELEYKKKWIAANGTCLGWVQDDNGTCFSNYELNCNGTCEFEQSMFQCGDECQSVETQCDGQCTSKGRPWRCPTNPEKCVSDYICSIHDDISKIEFHKEKENCIFVKENLKKVCERPEGLKDVKCSDTKVACMGHRKQCIMPENICDKKLDCMDRSDESNCNVKSKKFVSDIFIDCLQTKDNIYKISNKAQKAGNQGFQCGEDFCLDQNFWCGIKHKKTDWPDSILLKNCKDILNELQNEKLCSNFTFWHSRQCNPKTPWRCNGNHPGECSRGSAWACEGLEYSGCKDRSDLVCNSTSKICQKDFMVSCHNGQQCVHEDLWCDGYEHCSDGSDEMNCTLCPRIKGFPRNRIKEANKRCKHRYKINHNICSVPCDGFDDICLDEDDEKSCNENPTTQIIILIIALIFISLVAGEITFKNQFDPHCNEDVYKVLKVKDVPLIGFLQANQDEDEPTDRTIAEFRKVHKSEKYADSLLSVSNLFLFEIDDLNKKCATLLYKHEYQYHEGNVGEIDKCLMKNVGTNKATEMLYKIGATNNGMELLANCTSRMFGNQEGNVYWCLNEIYSCYIITLIRISLKGVMFRFFVMVLLYIVVYFTDFIKDIFFIIKYFKFFDKVENIKEFRSQILVLMIVSVILPTVANIFLAKSYINKLRITNLKTKMFALMMIPLWPMVNLYVRERLTTLQEIQSIKFWRNFVSGNQESNLAPKVFDFSSEIKQMNRLHARFRMNENSFEHFTQAAILIIILLLKYSSTRTVTGLQELFAGDDLGFVVISALWSCLSLAIGYLHWVTYNKGNYIPGKGKLILGIIGIISIFARLSAIILFFAPTLGLIDLLGHYEMGKLNTATDTLVYEYNETFVDAWKRVQLSDYESLTSFRLKDFYIAFFFVVSIHYIFVFVIKYFYAIDFKSKRNMFEKVLHVFSQNVYPLNYKDWDESDKINIDNWRKSCREILLLNVLFALEHIVLCIPMFILTKNIFDRNEILDHTFPQVLEEKRSTRNAIAISVAFPIFFLILPIVQYILFLWYNKFGHPWSKVLNNLINKTEGSESILIENMQEKSDNEDADSTI